MKILKLSVFLFVFLAFLVSCKDEESLYDEVTITVKNATDESIFIFVDHHSQSLSMKDFTVWINPNSLEFDQVDSGKEIQYKTEKRWLLESPFYNIFIFKSETISLFSKEELVEYDIFDDSYHLTYADLKLYDFKIVYDGYSHWKEQN